MVAWRWQRGSRGGRGGSRAVVASFAAEAVAWQSAILVVAAVHLEVRRHRGGGGGDY